VKPQDIVKLRLLNQRIAETVFKKPEEVVAWQGAVQAQDYPGGLWGVGLRTQKATLADVEKAIAERKIIRSWPMRGTLHFMAGADARWMLELLTPRINQSGGWVTRRKFLGLEESDIATGARLVGNALRGGKILTRQQLYDVLERGGVLPAKQRGLHILSKLAHELLICFGPHQGKQPTFVLLDEWLPKTNKMDREHALAEVARRYFTSHGPATLQDFVWWSGLKVSDAKAGLNANTSELQEKTVDGVAYWMPRNLPQTEIPSPDVHLLPPFDEYLVAYRDRSAAVELDHAPKVFRAGNGIFSPVLVIDGKVAGTWGRTTKKSAVHLAVTPFAKLTRAQADALKAVGKRYGTFLGLKVSLQ